MNPTRPTPARPAANIEALERDLRRSVRGEVRFDEGTRALYATDASNYRHVPIGVVAPVDAEDAVRALATCRSHDAPVLARGGGTSLAGQCCNAAVVFDLLKHMNRLVELDPERRLARVEPGIVLDRLREAAESHRLTFGPDPATHNHCTIGGMIGNNSCGIHSLMAGRTSENVEAMEILTYDGNRFHVGPTSDEDLDRIVGDGGRHGSIYGALRSLRDRYADDIRRIYPDIPRRVSGYNLDALLPESGFHVARALVGSECTCVLVLEATLRLIPSPRSRVLLVLGYRDVYEAADHVPDVLEAEPIGLEGMDERLVGDVRRKGLHPDDVALLPEGEGWLLAEFGGDSHEEAVARARSLMDRLEGHERAPSWKLLERREEAHRIWTVRESGLGATARVPGLGDTWEGWEDSAVDPSRLGEYLRSLRKLFDKYGYSGAFYGHFGQGCVHTRINFDLVTRDGITAFRSFLDEAADLVVAYGGSLSGEHGDGQSRAELLPKMFGPRLMDAFREFKGIWDPEGRMNPGKIVDARGITDDLRLGTRYAPPRPETHFAYPDDGGSFARATTRCVGVGECLRERGGTMCPSYRVTREEAHSTRGRAHLLFEMMEGSPLRRGWRSESVKEALDLCLACKGCKGDCPVAVDVATYKAEFLSHYYARRLRPRTAYALGWIYWTARAASRVPWLANFVTHAPVLRGAAKAIAGISSERRIPAFASRPFRSWFQSRERERGGAPPERNGARAERDGPRPAALLWPDTFTNHFYPDVGIAATHAIEQAGFRVRIPPRSLCCGRPLYDYGMLDLAKRQLREILGVLSEEIAEGTPVIVLEPSCLAVFRDELVNLFPHDLQAKRLSRQASSLSEFLIRRAPSYEPPTLRRKAIVHGHCHQKAVVGMDAERRLYERMGLEATVLDSGCCGMAGSFGFERDHYDLSLAVAEHELLPLVRDADRDTILVADGFSCREQIAQTTDRRALHTAEVLAMAMRDGPDGPRSRPEPAGGGR